LGDDVAVLGAEIRLERAIDLLDISAEPSLRAAYESMRLRYRRARQRRPRQTRLLHGLDREVIERAVAQVEAAGELVGAVRGAFQEGEPIFWRSALINRNHVQIAVRDTDLIEEVWLVRRAP
jgi:hypothetical protein